MSSRRLAISSSGTLRRELAVGDVEGDGVAFVDGGDGAAEVGFGSDVAGHQAARGSGEAAVGEQGDGFGELGMPLMAAVTASISRMPGPPRGPS